ncbi:ABC-2 family transporter protein [Cyanobium sp. ATX 6A2]|jgi:ABC-2 type transport system permease protein|uniref:ABC transporter permease n=1 Tax=Cyanobium sp. ATX 6A2 TaxID=2823700 RepID=UPI0020CC6F3E|nr:ABC-2 family transporter protein [Cyanobium sp. ATX 6A2]MCP9887291.1 ABC-2 family transporter protein [Cyanobium sp. ATX 6A2]
MRWRLARTLWLVQFAYMAEYRAEIALWALSGVLPFIMLGLWSAAAGSGAGGGLDLGLSPAELGRYFLCVFVVRQFSVVWVVWQFEEDALQGRLSPYLLQPLHPLWRYVAAHQAEQATRLPFVLLIASLFFLLQPQSFAWPGPARVLLGVLAVGLAFAINFLLQSLIATLCFWSERASALERLLYVPTVFLSGLVAPLQAFPPELRRLALHTPFPYLIGFPAQVLAGNPMGEGQPFGLAAGFAAMALWIALLLPLLVLLWRAGVRRYSAMGA